MHIDVAESLKAVSLEYLPLEVLPSGLLVDKLASEVARLKNKKISKPFVMVDLRDYLPFWCEELGSRSEDASLEGSDGDDDQKKKDAKAKPKRRRLNVLQWFAAFEAYALAADFTKQWSFASAMAHKRIRSEVAARSEVSKRRHYLAIFYDQVARKKWSECAYALGDRFLVDEDVPAPSMRMSKIKPAKAKAKVKIIAAIRASIMASATVALMRESDITKRVGGEVTVLQHLLAAQCLCMRK